MAALTTQGWHETADGMKLFTKTWTPPRPAIARVIFLHGFCDHCTRFTDLFRNLVSYGISVHAFDQRGWGHSVSQPSEKGLTGPTSQVLADITSFISTLLPSPVPLFLMGHSMGGQEVLTYAIQGPQDIVRQIRGFLAEAPYIKSHPSDSPSWLSIAIGRLVSRVFPHWQIFSKLEPKWMCRDEETRKDWPVDELCHDTATFEGIFGMLDRSIALCTGKPGIEDWDGLSIVGFHGTGDMCASFEATKEVFDMMPVKDKTLFIYEGVYHCIHLEPEADKMRFTRDAAEWIMARAKPVAARAEST